MKCPLKYQNQSRLLTKEFFSLLADLANVRAGTKVFFYKRRIDEPPNERGFLGVWQAIPYNSSDVVYEDFHTKILFQDLQILGQCPHCYSSKSEVEPNKKVIICSECNKPIPGHILPIRFLIAPQTIYSKYIDDNTAYIDVTDDGRLSTLIFRKIYGAGRERSATPILPEECEKLERLLKKVASSRNASVPFMKSYPSNPLSTNMKPISDYLDFSNNNFIFISKQMQTGPLYNGRGEARYETILEFWMIHQLASNPQNLLSQLGLTPNEVLEWFGNQVLFGIGGEKSDVVLLFKNEEGLRCRAVIVELKKGTISRDTFSQLRQYAYWIAQLVTANIQGRVAQPFFITPIAIGHHKAQTLNKNNLPQSFTFTIPYQSPLSVQVDQPKVFEYLASSSGIQLTRVL